MYKNKRIFGLITARAGSKRLKNKNTLSLLGKPLFYYTVNEALKSKYLDKVYLSTNDNKIIKKIKNSSKVKLIKREKKFSKDKTKTEEIILNFVKKYKNKFDIIFLLQPTSPLRKNFDIDNSIKKMLDNGSKAIISVSKDFKNIKDSIVVKKNFFYKKSKHKDIKKSYTVNGAIYVAENKFFMEKKTFITRKTLVYFMPKSRSIDIDTEKDFLLAKKFLK